MSVTEALDLLAEPHAIESRWDEILRLAHENPELSRKRPSWRVALAAAAVLVAILTATAFATRLVDRFSSWVSGDPGTPAPAGLQAGFDARNDVSLASFPAGTRLRLLLRERASGTSFDLLGFRNGDAYCLRLVRTDRPGGRGSNQCLRADELRGRAALVADDAWFRVGVPEISITGVYGFASDDVEAVRVTRARGLSVVPVRNNVFLSLRGQPTGTVQRHPQPNPVEAITARLRDGSLRNIPYAIPGGGILPGGAKPSVPSYFAPVRPGSIPGAPHAVTAPIRRPTIGWLARREKRGASLPANPKLDRLFRLDFARVIQPDPDDPVRVGVGVGPAHGMTRGHPIRGTWLCVLDFESLTAAWGSAGCGPMLTSARPIALGSWSESPITQFKGLAADGITRVDAYLAPGQRVRAALRDNVFSVAVPRADLPGVLVGYRASGKVAALVDLPGNAVARPCPPAELPTPIAQLPAPRKWEQLDLATLAVAGQPIIGKTPAQVRAILGEPAAIRPNAQRVNDVAIPEYRYGGSTPATLGLSVYFIKRGAAIVASSLYFQAPSLVDSQLGHVLRMQPTELQHRLVDAYGSRYRLVASYGGSQLRCSGNLRARSGPAGVDFGLDPHRPSRPYLEIRANG